MMLFLLVLSAVPFSLATNYGDVVDLLSSTTFTSALSENEVFTPLNSVVAKACEGTDIESILKGMMPVVMGALKPANKGQIMIGGTNVMTCLLLSGSSIPKFLTKVQDIGKKTPLQKIYEAIRKKGASMKKNFGSCSSDGALEQSYGIALKDLNAKAIKKMFSDFSTLKGEYNCVKTYFKKFIKFP